MAHPFTKQYSMISLIWPVCISTRFTRNNTGNPTTRLPSMNQMVKWAWEEVGIPKFNGLNNVEHLISIDFPNENTWPQRIAPEFEWSSPLQLLPVQVGPMSKLKQCCAQYLLWGIKTLQSTFLRHDASTVNVFTPRNPQNAHDFHILYMT